MDPLSWAFFQVCAVAGNTRSCLDARRELLGEMEASQELLIGGSTDPQRKGVGLGALLMGHFKLAREVTRKMA